MFPFWHDVVAPVIEAARARRIVEVGALRGENTELMLERLGPEVQLHVIDPLPDFDPAEHEQKFGGQYFFYRDLSVNVLDKLPVMDVALIDGDHNWFTVYTECSQLAAVATRESAPLPVLILHDVEWPYGKRDLYYDPSNIPEEHLQPWARAGMRRGVSDLATSGVGMNPTLANATHEGGPRNGVMTGLDDFIAEYPKPLRKVVLPLYFGLAIVVEEERLAAQPELAAVLDRLESNEGKDELLRLGEGIRLDAITFDQALLRLRDERIGRLGRTYLDTVKSAILNDHHIHNEVLIHHLRTAAVRGNQPNADLMRDPVRNSYGIFDILRRRHRNGERERLQKEAFPKERVEDDGLETQGFASSGRVGLDILERALDDVWGRHLRGDIASVGFGKGGSAILLAAYLEANDQEHRRGMRRTLWVADRFLAAEGRADLNQARERLAAFGLLDDRVRFISGEPATALRDLTTEQQTDTTLAVLHLGPGLGDDVTPTLEVLHDRVAVGGVIVVEDGDDAAVAAAVKAFRTARGVTAELVHEGPGVLRWTKEVEPIAADATADEVAARDRHHVVVAKRGRILAPDLSVVVVVHNMKREAARTLHSLSRRYQLDIDELTYDVVVIENGSDPDQVLGEEYVRSFGKEFRYIDWGQDATPSPTHALNRALAATTGHAVAFMIDGAHVLSPRVLHYGMVGLGTYRPAVVAPQAWYVGPGQQGDAMAFGYDQAVEDKLFEKVKWPEDGYRLFEIGHFQGDRDWFDGLWESNCLFVDRDVLIQAGGFDEGFSLPGGGYTNLEFYERMTSTPGVRVVTMLGEGTFHQIHGGTTTNIADDGERRARVRSYAEQYEELRGKPFQGPEKPIQYVGGFHSESSKRSRARRMTGKAFTIDQEKEGLDGAGQNPAVPIPDDLRDTFTTAYFRSLSWRKTKWLGHPVMNAPNDLHAYQQLLAEVKPDWVVDIAQEPTGRAFYLATICDLLDHGSVLEVVDAEGDSPSHPRIQRIVGQAEDADTVAAVRKVVGDSPKALVVLGTRGKRDRLIAQFEAYCPMVSVGSFVVIEFTTLNGFPIDATFGPGPHEALRRIMNVHGEFVAEAWREHPPTFNHAGLLRRKS